jgi:hypothetical protein
MTFLNLWNRDNFTNRKIDPVELSLPMFARMVYIIIIKSTLSTWYCSRQHFCNRD